ncbi:hypothetical protein I302_106155 [Kwoniella bestiolae CBS 10118]|uniref:Uncharacterized protein n=1 Tax=Kwoniella bestiolae CBS 10118 TaxID=1296100 RepID=A0A1B9G385_9TREE|nr:hypothetical protein I302_05278 [Kwoniella bestiolae CBS 10118]OCF25458.1 hypothetical protein I302_05278 [Kwoniella bestiolae CBS 10118]
MDEKEFTTGKVAQPRLMFWEVPESPSPSSITGGMNEGDRDKKHWTPRDVPRCTLRSVFVLPTSNMGRYTSTKKDEEECTLQMNRVEMKSRFLLSSSSSAHSGKEEVVEGKPEGLLAISLYGALYSNKDGSFQECVHSNCVIDITRLRRMIRDIPEVLHYTLWKDCGKVWFDQPRTNLEVAGWKCLEVDWNGGDASAFGETGDGAEDSVSTLEGQTVSHVAEGGMAGQDGNGGDIPGGGNVTRKVTKRGRLILRDFHPISTIRQQIYEDATAFRELPLGALEEPLEESQMENNLDRMTLENDGEKARNDFRGRTSVRLKKIYGPRSIIPSPFSPYPQKPDHMAYTETCAEIEVDIDIPLNGSSADYQDDAREFRNMLWDGKRIAIMMKDRIDVVYF